MKYRRDDRCLGGLSRSDHQSLDGCCVIEDMAVTAMVLDQKVPSESVQCRIPLRSRCERYSRESKESPPIGARYWRDLLSKPAAYKHQGDGESTSLCEHGAPASTFQWIFIFLLAQRVGGAINNPQETMGRAPFRACPAWPPASPPKPVPRGGEKLCPSLAPRSP